MEHPVQWYDTHLKCQCSLHLAMSPTEPDRKNMLIKTLSGELFDISGYIPRTVSLIAQGRSVSKDWHYIVARILLCMY